MREMPIIRVDLECVRDSIMHSFIADSNEINKIVVEELDNILSEEWIRASIKSEVANCVKSAISGISDSIMLQRVISEKLTECIVDSIAGATNE